MTSELHADRLEYLERAGYWRVELGPQILTMLAESGASLIFKVSGTGAVECTLPELEPELARYERVEHVPGIGGRDDSPTG